MAYISYKKIDEVGRVVLPKDIRKEMDLHINDMLKIDIDNGKIIITKADKSCIFCGKTSSLKSYLGKTVCESCIKELNNS